MRTTITRKLIVNTIHGYTVNVDENGVATANAVDPITLYGNISRDQAQKELVKVSGKSNAVVGKVDTAEKVFEISVEDFVKNAKVVEKEATEETN